MQRFFINSYLHYCYKQYQLIFYWLQIVTDDPTSQQSLEYVGIIASYFMSMDVTSGLSDVEVKGIIKGGLQEDRSMVEST